MQVNIEGRKDRKIAESEIEREYLAQKYIVAVYQDAKYTHS